MRDPLARRAADARELVLGYLEQRRRGQEGDDAGLESAAELLYDPPEGDHVLEVADAGWAVEHPRRCHDLGDPSTDCMIGAALGSWLSLEVEPPLEPGRYLVEFDSRKGTTRVVKKLEEETE